MALGAGLGSANRIGQDAQREFDARLLQVTAANQPSKQPKEAAQACAGSFFGLSAAPVLSSVPWLKW
jgi:hypothetical protein